MLFGEVWAREAELSPRDRSLATVSALIGAGILDSSLKAHLQKALDKIDEPVGEETYPKWYLTGRNILSEQPLNIILYRNQLEDLATSHWLVTRKELINLDKK